MCRLHRWSEEEKDYLAKITPGHSYKEIQMLLNKKFCLDFSLSQVKGAIQRYNLNTGLNGRFKKGSTPWNKGMKGTCAKGSEKTWFKKGNIPLNYRPVGSTRVNTFGYTEIKIKDPATWKFKHTVIWEQHNGPVPKGYCVIFADKDKSNFNLNNLVLVSRRELAILNQQKLIKNDSEITKTGVIIAKLYAEINKRKCEG